MMYSSWLMEGGENNGLGRLEEKVGELERLAEDLGNVPDEELVATLDRAVELLKEVNTGIENGMKSFGEEARELEGLLEPLDFEEFDSELEKLERKSREADEAGP